jgi:hypothetical protein
MAKKDETTWGEVCKRVTMGDTLYSTCREKVSGYGPGGFAGGALDEFHDDDADFDAKLASSALAIPEPPPKSALRQRGRRGDDEGMGGILDEMDLGKILMYGGVVALVWFLLRKKPQEVVTTTAEPEIKTLGPKPMTNANAA